MSRTVKIKVVKLPLAILKTKNFYIYEIDSEIDYGLFMDMIDTEHRNVKVSICVDPEKWAKENLNNEVPLGYGIAFRADDGREGHKIHKGFFGRNYRFCGM
jgi:hypothetical protein